MPLKNDVVPQSTKGAVKRTKYSGNTGKVSKDELTNMSMRRIVPKNTNLNQTVSNAAYRGNITVAGGEDSKETEDLVKKISYNDYLESLFLEALVDEKIDKEKLEIDVKMAELAKRLEINKLILRKTQDRLKNISFLSEQQRITSELKSYTSELENEVNKFQAEDLLDSFIENQDLYCNRLLTKNINLGNEENNAYKELHSAILQTIESLNEVKAECNLSNNEVDTISNISQQLKACHVASEQIESNLKQHQSMGGQVSSNVVEVASIELASTLS